MEDKSCDNGELKKDHHDENAPQDSEGKAEFHCAHENEAGANAVSSSSGKIKMTEKDPFEKFPVDIWRNIGRFLDDIEVVPFLSAWKGSKRLNLAGTYSTSLPSLPAAFEKDAVLSERILYRVHQLQSSTASKGFLVKLEKRSKQKFRAFDPITLRALPSVSFRKIRLLDYRFIQIRKVHALNFRCHSQHGGFMCLEKASIISDPQGWKECAFLSGGGLFMRAVKDNDWSYVDGYDIHDILAVRGMMFVVESNGVLSQVDTESKALTAISAPTPKEDCCNDKRQKHLVYSSGDIYLVDRMLSDFRIVTDDKDDGTAGVDYNAVYKFKTYNERAKTVNVKVYKLAQHQWVEVHQLDDHVFFLCPEGSFSQAAVDCFAEPIKNTIYLNDWVLPSTEELVDIRVFNLETSSITDYNPRKGFDILNGPPNWIAGLQFQGATW